MSQALYRKWRPQRWEQVVGQEHIISTLRNAVAAERVAHAYLFAGPRGTGKTTTARLLAKAVNCLEEDLAKRPCDECEHCIAINQGRFLDLIEIDAASNTSVEDVRDLRDKINFSPNRGRFKVYIIDEVHMLSTAAFNALLKTLEEPPPHAIFVLATTEIHKIPATVLSRCQRHEFRRIPVADIVSHLKEMAASENLQVDEDALHLLARQATGSLRDAISLLDQLSSTGEAITLEIAQEVLGTAANQSVLEIVQALINSAPAAGLECIHRTLDAGSDARQFARQIVDYLRGLLLVRMGNADQIDATSDLRAQMAQHAQAFENHELLRVIKLFNQAATEARQTWQPSLPLEMALIEALEDETPAESTTTSIAGGKEPKAANRKIDSPPLQTTGNQSTSGSGDPDPVRASEAALQVDPAFAAIRENWDKLLKIVRRGSPNVEALLRSGRILGMKGDVFYFGLTEVLKEKMDKPENLALVQQALEKITEKELRFACVISSGSSGSLPPDVDTEGMVAAALRDLGGEIVDIQ
jgi:DNA polymerase-3 subunit gamma/tau